MPPLIACVTIPRLLSQLAIAAQPDLARHPLVVAAHASDRAIVLDYCPRAAACGVQDGQSVWEARRRCPALRVTTVPAEHVAATTAQVVTVLRQHADTVLEEAVNAWSLPLVALGAGFRAAPRIVQQLQRDVDAATGLACVITVSRARPVARIVASTLEPPDYRVILPGDEATALAPLPARLLPGVGPLTEGLLAQLGVTSIGDLTAISEALLLPVLGMRGRTLVTLARGQDVTPEREIPQVVRHTWRFEQTPCADARRLRAVLYLRCEQVGRDLRQQGCGTGRLTVQLTLLDGRTIQRAIPARARVDLDPDLAQLAFRALAALQGATRLAIRAVTVEADDLGPLQVDLFADGDRPRRRQQAIDQIKRRYGGQAITIAALLPDLRRAA